MAHQTKQKDDFQKQKIDFKTRVCEIVKKIPAGKTLSYRRVAKLAGSPNAARAVGSIMRKNSDTKIPCHRVIRADGAVGDYNRGGALSLIHI